MTQRFGCILLAAVLLLTLAACKTQYEEPTGPTEPTLPSVPLDQTPAQQLSAALHKTGAQDRYEVRYGTRNAAGENTDTQSVSQSRPLDRDELYAKAPELPDREDFLDQFCGRSLMVNPSNTGVIRYLLMGLSWEDARSLLYSGEREAPLEDAIWTVTLTVDGEGRFCEFEFTGQREGESWSAFLTITFPDSQ